MPAYASIARQYADWGVDYVKCDDICYVGRGRFYCADEIEALSRSLRASGRSIMLEPLARPGAGELRSASARVRATLWRISGDFWDNWRALTNNFTN